MKSWHLDDILALLTILLGLGMFICLVVGFLEVASWVLRPLRP